MNDDQFFLANAYLDGELTAEERRIAEADPDVMSEVEQLRGLQAELRDVEAPTDATRDAAISAAMTEFGRRDSAAPVAAAPIPFRPRPAYAKYLAVAAALVAVAGLGIVVTQSGLGGNDDDSAAVAPAAEEPAEEMIVAEARPSETVVVGDGADTAQTEMAADEAGGGDEAADDAGAAEPMADDDMGDAAVEEAAEMSEESTAEAAAEAPPVVRVAVPAEFDPDEPITDDEELAVYGAYLLELRDRDELPSTPNTACLGEAPILDEATFVLDDVATPVFIAVDELSGLVFALDVDRCRPLVVASLF